MQINLSPLETQSAASNESVYILTDRKWRLFFNAKIFIHIFFVNNIFSPLSLFSSLKFCMIFYVMERLKKGEMGEKKLIFMVMVEKDVSLYHSTKKTRKSEKS